MTFQILVSTMNIKNKTEHNDLLKKMNIKSDSVIINQCTDNNINLVNITSGKNKLFSYFDRGLSKSRNLAIENATADICIIADNDLCYNDNCISIIRNAYNKYPHADIIAFYVESQTKGRPTSNQSEKKISFLSSMKIASFQITFKRNSILQKNIRFDENFGAGSDNFSAGEENIFLVDCLKKGLNIYYVPITIATVNHLDSTWFHGYDKKYFETKGAVFYRMSNVFNVFLIFQFIIRKYKRYHKEISLKNAVKYMFSGKHKYKKIKHR